MRDLIKMLRAFKGDETDVIEIATGKYEFTGEIWKSVKKIIKNGKREDSI
jgi:hypothetical protein